MATIVVDVTREQHRAIKKKAREDGKTIAALLRDWIDGFTTERRAAAAQPEAK